jgi:hypothetical protein
MRIPGKKTTGSRGRISNLLPKDVLTSTQRTPFRICFLDYGKNGEFRFTEYNGAMLNTPTKAAEKQIEKANSLELVCACVVGFAFSTNYTNHAPLVLALTQTFDPCHGSFSCDMSFPTSS